VRVCVWIDLRFEREDSLLTVRDSMNISLEVSQVCVPCVVYVFASTLSLLLGVCLYLQKDWQTAISFEAKSSMFTFSRCRKSLLSHWSI
jgi:hypothetical protein